MGRLGPALWLVYPVLRLSGLAEGGEQGVDLGV
jgi:hypothetical protein